jgi:hypothetical protein
MSHINIYWFRLKRKSNKVTSCEIIYCYLPKYCIVYSFHDVNDCYGVKLSQSQSYIATDGQSVSMSWCQAPSGAHGQILITL